MMLARVPSEQEQQQLRAALVYEPDTGLLRWRADRPRRGSMGRNMRAGEVAGSLHVDEKHVQIRMNRQAYKGHLVAWLLYYGEWPAERIKHADKDRSNNAIGNLVENPVLVPKVKREITHEFILSKLKRGFGMTACEVANRANVPAPMVRKKLMEMVDMGLVTLQPRNSVVPEFLPVVEGETAVAGRPHWSPFEGDLCATSYNQDFARHRAICEEMRQR